MFLFLEIFQVLVYIFTFLNVTERKLASRVCKLWYFASLHPKLQEHTVFILTNNTNVTVARNIGQRRPANVIFRGLDSSSHSKLLLSTVSHSWESSILHSLLFESSVISETDFINVLSKCSSVQRLSVNSCDSLFMSGNLLRNNTDRDLVQSTLVNVKELVLCSNRYLSDNIFNILMSLMPNVKKLSLSSCHISFHSSLYLVGQAAASCIMTFHNIRKFITDRAKLIKVMNFSKTSIDDKALTILAETPNLQLEEINLEHCQEVTDEGIEHLCMYQQQIQSVNVSGCHGISDKSIRMIAEKLSCLKRFNASKCNLLGEDAVYFIAGVEFLEELNMSRCFRLTSASWIKSLHGRAFKNVTVLNLSYCTMIDDKAVAEIAKMPELKHLDLSSCFNITDKSVQAICINLGNLSYLNFAWCSEIQNLILEAIQDVLNADKIKEQEHGKCKCTKENESFKSYLDLKLKKPEENIKPELLTFIESDCRANSDPNLKPFSINSLKNLKVLNLCGCTRLLQESLQNLKLYKLRHLNLSMCTAVTDDHLIHISDCCSLLVELQLSQCHLLTDTGTAYVLAHNHLLEGLDISGCDRLTDCTLELVSKLGRCLRYLDVSMCRGLHFERINKLEEMLPHVRIVNVMQHEECTPVTSSIISRFQNLKKIFRSKYS